jgi:hypothetical protein
MNLDERATRDAIQVASELDYGEKDSTERFRRVTSHLRRTLTPAYETLFSRMLAQVPDGMAFLVQLRADLLSQLRSGREREKEKKKEERGKETDFTDKFKFFSEETRHLKDLDTNLKR